MTEEEREQHRQMDRCVKHMESCNALRSCIVEAASNEGLVDAVKRSSLFLLECEFKAARDFVRVQLNDPTHDPSVEELDALVERTIEEDSEEDSEEDN